MGGINSGRRAHTPDTDDCLQLSLAVLRRSGALRRHQMARSRRVWQRGDRKTGEVAITVDIDSVEPTPCLVITGWGLGERIAQRLTIVSQPLPFGGERFYVLCPITGLRCSNLILPPNRSFFASARGWRVPYASTRERKVDRALRAMDKIEVRFASLTKHTRQRTLFRLEERWCRAAENLRRWEEDFVARA